MFLSIRHDSLHCKVKLFGSTEFGHVWDMHLFTSGLGLHQRVFVGGKTDVVSNLGLSHYAIRDVGCVAGGILDGERERT